MAKKKDEAVEVVKKPRGAGKNIGEVLAPITDPGDNTMYLQQSLELMQLPNIDMKDPVAVQNRINEYFGIMAKYDTKPTVAGLGLALNGMDRRRLWEIRTDVPGRNTDLNSEVRDAVKKAYKLMENLWENYMQNGKVNPVAGIFLGKNNFGYQDKTEYVVTPNTRSENDYDADEIRKRYALDDATIVIDPSDSE
jgi:hypothetical protein